jgi:hypothetical protein
MPTSDAGKRSRFGFQGKDGRDVDGSKQHDSPRNWKHAVHRFRSSGKPKPKQAGGKKVGTEGNILRHKILILSEMIRNVK